MVNKAYNHRQGIKVSTYNKHLEKFENVNKGRSGMLLIPAPSFIDRWKEKPNIPEYDECVKLTVNRMIYLNPTVALDVDYYFFGSWFNLDLEYQKLIKEFLNKSKAEKFASAYENGWSHKDIDRGNITPEQCAEFGVNPFESNDQYWSNDPSKYNFFGHTIAFPPLQFLLYTGISTLYIVGADCGYTLPSQHVIEGDPYLMGIWKLFKEWVQNEPKYKHVKIISINPVSLKGMFNDRFID